MLCLVDNFDFVVVYSYFGDSTSFFSSHKHFYQLQKSCRSSVSVPECPRDELLGAPRVPQTRVRAVIHQG